LWGYWGEILSVAAQVRNLGGLVLEGGSRDHAALPIVGFPVVSLGPCIRGTIKDKESKVGRLGGAIEIGGVVIRPGDLLVGDQDGVVAIAAEDAEATLIAGRAREAKEAVVMDSLRNGATTIDIYGLG
jgi:4-hydroxy-4-methyl-2-oxoglutarate aldolase